MAERLAGIPRSVGVHEPGSSRWKSILKYGAIAAGVGLALVLAAGAVAYAI